MPIVAGLTPGSFPPTSSYAALSPAAIATSVAEQKPVARLCLSDNRARNLLKLLAARLR